MSSNPETTQITSIKQLNIHWFRQTALRIHDNPALCRTIELSSTLLTEGNDYYSGILPVFVFDTSRIYGSTVSSNLGCRKCGPRRAQFVLEAVQDLRCNLEKAGSGLVVAVGKPEIILAEIVKGADAAVEDGGVTVNSNIVCQEEVCSEELAVDKAVQTACSKSSGGSIHFETVWGSTLYEPNTLPFDNGISDTFTPFRKEVEENCTIGVPLHMPSDAQLKLPHHIKKILKESKCSLDYMPTLADLGYSTEDIVSTSAVDRRSAMPQGYRGGETFALARVQEYIWDLDLLKTYFDTRNGMIGENYSTKFAPWLALGNVSPRYIARECRRYEEMRVANKSTYWVVFELLVRDYFKFFAMKHGDAIFYPYGTTGKHEHVNKRKWDMDPKQIQAWKDGMTGYPLVDATMRELAATGFSSNRGRQNACSFFAIDMNMDWRFGADYFEEMLLDYDVHSNWLNWANGAGVTGGRLNRFNIVKQSNRYDKGGDFVRLWCPELNNVPDEYVHEPWNMSENLMEECGVVIGKDYPSPIVVPSVQPRIANNNRVIEQGQRSKKGSGKGNNYNTNPNRGKGQREDMKSLKQGTYQFSS